MISFGRSARIEVWTGLVVAFGAIDTSKLTSPVLVQVALACVATACAIEIAMSPVVSIRSISDSPLRWFALWVAWAAGTAVFAPSGPSAVWTAGLFAVLGVAAVHINEASGEIGLARTLVGAFGVLVVVSVLVRVVGGNSDSIYQGSRLALLTLEANQLVRMAALTALASVYMVLFGRRSRSVPFIVAGGIAFVGSVFVVLAGESRTGSAALIVGLLVFTVASAPRPRQRAMAAVGGATVLVALAFAVLALGGLGEVFDRVETAASREEGSADSEREVESLNGRLDIWPEILTEVRDQPISGYGLGNDRKIVTDLFAVGRIGWMAQHTHNLALQVLLTTGVVGLALMMAAITSVAARAFDSATPLGPALFVLMLIDGISEAAIRVPSFGWFALVAAAAIASQRAGVQLSAENTVVTRSSISSTARS